ncbi:MAG: CSLREA domain-containing protein [Candidatus Dadabacteria bacterium]|nr:CSLREA domain-containing protein [Candidatus Dadabacteria bacterium]
MFYRTLTALKFFLLFSAFIFISTPNIYAALILPDIFTDEFTANSDCSLREAIESMNDGADMLGCTNTGAVYGTADQITLPTGTYVLSIQGTDDTNAAGDLDMLVDLIIRGGDETDPTTTIIDGECDIQNAGAYNCACGNDENNRLNDRLFHILGTNTVTFMGVTLRGGWSSHIKSIFNSKY